MRNIFVVAVLLLAACGRPLPDVTVHSQDAIPERLSEWGVVVADGKSLQLNDHVLPYELNTPLFTDYALKLRTVWMPTGTAATYDANDEFDFPVGTIISKTFHYEKSDQWTATNAAYMATERDARLGDNGKLNLDEHVLIETRLLVRYDTGWRAFPYVWNKDQTEAWLEVAGDVKPMTLIRDSGAHDFLYVVPDSNQCAGCHAPNHTDADIRPIGPKARHLNRDYSFDGVVANQIEHWAALAVLEDVPDERPGSVRWSDPDDGTLNERARAYLDINCAHCHNSVGAADTSGLHLNVDAPVDRNFGICKSPTAVGQGSGDRLYDIHPGQPDESILVYRMDHTDPAIAMPELGRSTIHAEGVSLIRAWVSELEGEC